jgi:hypothetical protein
MSILLSVALVFLQAALHPVLTPDREALQKVWRNGYEYAQRHKTPDPAVRWARHGIGKMDGFYVSWVTMLHPRLLAFEAGFAAGKQSLQEIPPQAEPGPLAGIVQESAGSLGFRCELGIYPAGALSPGAISRRANPRDLKDIQVSLQVGPRVYGPVRQPGEIVPEVHQDWHMYTVWYANQSPSDFGVYERFTWYAGCFTVRFDLYNADKTPRITRQDKELTFIVRGRFGKQTARFSLEEWQSAFEK